MDQTSPNLTLPYLQAAQAQKHVTHNEALERLDLIVQLTVQSFAETTPPLTPLEGQIWAVGQGAVNDWTGQEGMLAAWANGGWLFVTPRVGWQAVSGTEQRIWDGADWVSPDLPELQNLAGVGVNTTYDGTNRLAVSAEATLLTHDGAGHQLKINKAAPGDTASLLFQTGWSGRAEMGLAGNDDFSIKVSDDGISWTAALSVLAASGRVRLDQPVELPQGSATAAALGFVGDTDTGLFRVASDTLGVTTGGAERLRVTPAGMQVTGLISGTAVTQTHTDTTPGRLMLVGNFGLGAGTVPAPSSDFNQIGQSGFWHCDSNGINKPGFGSNFGLVSSVRGSTLAAQLALCLNPTAAHYGRVAARTRIDATTWSGWFELYGQNSALGTVAQSAGVPTGALIERGSNANGKFVRFADGTQICWSPEFTADSTTANGAIFSWANMQQWTFPAVFIATPVVTPAGQSNGRTCWAGASGISTAKADIAAISSIAQTSRSIAALAIGRWF